MTNRFLRYSTNRAECPWPQSRPDPWYPPSSALSNFSSKWAPIRCEAARIAISLASRSTCPLCAISLKTRCTSRSISCAASPRTASAIFFQSLQFLLILDLGHRAQPTNLFVDLDQFPTKAEKNLVILQLPVSLLQFRPEAQILRPTLAATGGVPQVLWPVSWMSGLGTNTSLLTAFTKVHRDRAGTKVSQLLHLLVQRASSFLKLFEGVGHGGLQSLQAILAFSL